MFTSKYIFETQHTRYVRYASNIFFLFALASILYTILCVGFILGSNEESKSSLDNFFKSSPDMIAVFTGDIGRIPYAIKKAKEYNQSNIFITGVYSKNSVETLLRPLEVSNNLDPNMLTIDYTARNTVENVISTLRHLRERIETKKILIISHDYHIMRIKLIVDKLKTPEDKFDFYYSGVKTDYKNYNNIKKLFKEVFKYIRTYAFLLIWASE